MGAYIFGGLFFSAVGLWMSIWGLRGHLTSRRGLAAARHWLEATAVVDSVGVHTTERRALGLLFLLTRGRNLLFYLLDPKAPRNSGANTYYPQVNYRFQVHGQTFHGARIAFGNLKRNFIVEARKLIAPYQAGGWIKVRYNPHDPRDNVIQTNSAGSFLWTAILGPVVLALGLLLLIGLPLGWFDAEMRAYGRRR